MKNSQLKNPNPKINLKDIVEGKAMREHNTFEVNGTIYWADRISKDQLATHADCLICGKEFEKDYTYQRHCTSCELKIDSENFNKLELIEWDGKTPLCIWDSDTFFFSEDDIIM
ncbi:hypothetical protein J3L18_00090 [Mucilaginibacter gossypii]|uniref:hypothetical protein n=1 Tax=Mucilaginibacter gossypii TaxID=551996 RepID=UPI000DCAF830|nr:MULTISPECIES: hypothetical protein [Mucilaginibacter]QTE37502.1 hypothetical protein J3L18_00090 [Mucilaginibacter gossypii]RAV52327.1 hypothetical protein DIU36_24645 [Mucilaginibacter rubeus]